MKSRTGRKLFNRILLYVVVIVTSIVIFFPIYWLINTALLGETDLFLYPPAFIPKHPSFEGFLKIIKDSQIFQWIKNSFVVTISTVVLNLVIATFAGYSLSRFRYKGRKLFMLAILCTQLIPGALVVVPLYVVFRQFRLINTLLGLIIGNIGLVTVFSTWVIKGFFDTLPREIEEAAYIDGCSRFGAFYRISVPLITPGLIAIALITFFDTWNEYLFAVTFISDQSRWVGTVGLTSFIGLIAIRWNEIMSASIIFVIPLLVLYLVLQKYIVSGLTKGAVKG